MSTLKCRCCDNPIPPNTGCYNTPYGLYCCKCYDNGGKEEVSRRLQGEPPIESACGRIMFDVKRPKHPDKYRFIRYKDNEKDLSQWYFVASTLDEMRIHFEKYCGTEIRDGIRNYLDNAIAEVAPGFFKLDKKVNTTFGKSLELMMSNQRGTPLSAAVVALQLENRTLQDRMRHINDGKILLLTADMRYHILIDSMKIVDDIDRKSMLFPDEKVPTSDDIKIMIWPGGQHYYAKIGKFDVQDEDGNVKWFTPEEAQFHASNTLIKLQLK